MKLFTFGEHEAEQIGDIWGFVRVLNFRLRCGIKIWNKAWDCVVAMVFWKFFSWVLPCNIRSRIIWAPVGISWTCAWKVRHIWIVLLQQGVLHLWTWQITLLLLLLS